MHISTSVYILFSAVIMGEEKHCILYHFGDLKNINIFVQNYKINRFKKND